MSSQTMKGSSIGKTISLLYAGSGKPWCFPGSFLREEVGKRTGWWEMVQEGLLCRTGDGCEQVSTEIHAGQGIEAAGSVPTSVLYLHI